MNRTLALTGCLAVVLGSGCEVFSVVCTTEARAGLKVTVLDSVSKAPLLHATVWARDGAFVDTLAVLNGGIAYGLFERAGRYVVNVQAEQYKPWSRSGVQITEDECHVRTVELTASVQPES